VVQSITQVSNAFSFSWSAVSGSVYQPQYKTNLLDTNWLSLGGPITATNSTATATDPAPADPQRFYRVNLQQP
jgi:hypothetical protein